MGEGIEDSWQIEIPHGDKWKCCVARDGLKCAFYWGNNNPKPRSSSNWKWWEQWMFSVEREYSLLWLVWAGCLFTAPPGGQRQLNPFAVQTVGGRTVCQICLLIQTLSLDPLVSRNTYLFLAIALNPLIQSQVFVYWHWLQSGVQEAAAHSLRQASRP